MRFEVTDDASEFSAVAGAFLEADLARNVIATVLEMAVAGLFTSPPVCAYALGDDGTVVFAALRTPPRLLLMSELPPGGAEPLLDAWLAADPELPGVAAPPASAAALGAAWSRRTGGHDAVDTAMALHALTAVTDPPRRAYGQLRLATRDERPRLLEWWLAFGQEAGLAGRSAHAAVTLDARLGDDRLFVWEAGGEPVSLVGVNIPVGGVQRVGPVYTPPEHRRRGYAGTAVADVSRRLLGGGARACMLTTDLANPTSNKIYAEVGYRRFGDWEERLFHRT